MAEQDLIPRISPNTDINDDGNSVVPVGKPLDSEINTSNLCPYCRHALSDWAKQVREYRYIESLQYPYYRDDNGVREAVDVHGCRICWLMLYSWKFDMDSSAEPSERLLEISPTSCMEIDHGRWHLRLIPVTKEPPLIYEKILSLIEIQGQEQSCINKDEKATNDLSSDYSLSLSQAKTWMKECLTSHPKCEGTTDRSNPTRLLHIGSGTVRLCSGIALPPGAKYATLSHCWGLLGFFKLKQNNISSTFQGICISELPKTFQDAILIGQELGFKYLWIDSLCIIQDDEADWSNESVTMSNVYSNAELNIAAVSAADGNDGCIFERPHSRFRKYQIPLVIGQEKKWFLCADDFIYVRGISEQPLAKRAWAVQERLLAQRTLFFSKTEIFWECNTKFASESFPTQLPGEMYQSFNKSEDKLDWGPIVYLYTSGELTYGRDKLVALAGIAKKIQETTGDVYLAGMWLDGLVDTLLWTTDDNPLRLRPEKRAPTWSWASIDGVIRIPSPMKDFRQRYTKVIDVLVDSKTNDAFGEVNGGVLTLGCKALLRGVVTRRTEEYPYQNNRSITFGNTIVRLWWYEDSAEDILQIQDEYYFIPFKWEFDIEGVIAIRTGDKHGQYSRKGMFRMGEPIAFTNMILGFQGENNPDDYIEIISDESGEKSYVIEII